ncbi:MAG: MCE family protein [Betaproteobacteria bacterium HGW-Betaproteobacteria-8]|nr:MAG: MCE family protein [Betaproteobacteria bacterium HGW-Betaproteobacteria-8]
MENRTYAIAVGLFTLLLGLFLLFSFWWLSGEHQKNSNYVVVSPIPITGLSVESAVKFRGVDVGKVTNITLDKTNKNIIRVEIRVQDDLGLSENSTARLRMQGVTGLAFIDLNDTTDPEAKPLAEGAEIPLHPSLVDKLMDNGPALIAQIESLLKSSNELATTANQLLGSIDHEKLNQTLTNLEQASTKLEPLLNTATTTFERMGNMASEQNQAMLSETLSSMQKTADAAQPLLGELNDTAREFRNMAQEIGQGSQQLSHTLNHETLPRIHELTKNMNRDMRQFSELLNNLEENPQSLILGKPPAKPGPGEDGFQPNTEN